MPDIEIDIQQCETCGGRVECANPREDMVGEIWNHATPPADGHVAIPDWGAADPNFYPAEVVQRTARSIREARLCWVGGGGRSFDEELARAALNSLEIHVVYGQAILLGVPGPATNV